MKITLTALTVAAGITSTLLTGSMSAQRADIINRAQLPEVENISRMRADDPARASGIPMADLVVKDMCLNETKGGLDTVRVLIANIGTVDAGAFELGFEYISAEGTVRFALDEVAGLKAAEEQWLVEGHFCCGLGARPLVYSSTAFTAIADPRYFKRGLIPGTGNDEVKSVIAESNEGNNKMSAKKSELRPCVAINKTGNTSTPSKLEPVRPRKP